MNSEPIKKQKKIQNKERNDFKSKDNYFVKESKKKDKYS